LLVFSDNVCSEGYFDNLKVIVLDENYSFEKSYQKDVEDNLLNSVISDTIPDF